MSVQGTVFPFPGGFPAVRTELNDSRVRVNGTDNNAKINHAKSIFLCRKKAKTRTKPNLILKKQKSKKKKRKNMEIKLNLEYQIQIGQAQVPGSTWVRGGMVWCGLKIMDN